MLLKTPDVIKDRPENCAVGEVILPDSVPHWDGRIRLTEFFPSNLAKGQKPWVFAATYKGLDPIGWRRVE